MEEKKRKLSQFNYGIDLRGFEIAKALTYRAKYLDNTICNSFYVFNASTATRSHPVPYLLLYNFQERSVSVNASTQNELTHLEKIVVPVNSLACL